jgi:hypothetical protein
MSKIALKHSTGNSMSIAAPATNPASDLELKLPATIGTAGQVLQNSSTPGTLEFGAGGRVLQVIQNLITDTHSEALATTHWATLGSFSNTSITPISTSNKILVSGWMSVGISSAMNVYLRLRRGSTVIAEADAAGSRRQGLSVGAPNDTNKMDAIPFWYLDSPSTTSATTYSVQLAHPSSSTRTIYINRDDTDTDAATGCRVCSSIVLQEIEA